VKSDSSQSAKIDVVIGLAKTRVEHKRKCYNVQDLIKEIGGLLAGVTAGFAFASYQATESAYQKKAMKRLENVQGYHKVDYTDTNLTFTKFSCCSRCRNENSKKHAENLKKFKEDFDVLKQIEETDAAKKRMEAMEQ